MKEVTLLLLLSLSCGGQIYEENWPDSSIPADVLDLSYDARIETKDWPKLPCYSPTGIYIFEVSIVRSTCSSPATSPGSSWVSIGYLPSQECGTFYYRRKYIPSYNPSLLIKCIYSAYAGPFAVKLGAKCEIFLLKGLPRNDGSREQNLESKGPKICKYTVFTPMTEPTVDFHNKPKH